MVGLIPVQFSDLQVAILCLLKFISILATEIAFWRILRDSFRLYLRKIPLNRPNFNFWRPLTLLCLNLSVQNKKPGTTPCNMFYWSSFAAKVFSCEFCKISKNIFFTEHLWATASEFIYSELSWIQKNQWTMWNIKGHVITRKQCRW